MAIVSLHKQLTGVVLRELGFGNAAVRIAAEANAKVDEQQGSEASQANLHAMRGYENGVMQSQQRAQEAVADLLRKRKADTTARIKEEDFKTALEELGAGLHTVQDRAYHGFEPWPFAGIGDAFFNSPLGRLHGLAPNYMLCHGVRDFGIASRRVNLSLSGLDYAAGYNAESGLSAHLSLQLNLSISRNPWVPQLSAAPFLGYDSGRGDWGAYGALSWGGTPGNMNAQVFRPRSSAGETALEVREPVCPEAAQGPESLDSARRDSNRFVQEIEPLVNNAALWTRFRNHT